MSVTRDAILKMGLGLDAIFRMEALQPGFVGLRTRVCRKPVERQIFWRHIFEKLAASKIDFESTNLSNTLDARELIDTPARSRLRGSFLRFVLRLHVPAMPGASNLRKFGRPGRRPHGTVKSMEIISRCPIGWIMVGAFTAK
jgi:hypothetical protein